MLTIGVVLDMRTEKTKNDVDYRKIADQTDYDTFYVLYPSSFQFAI